MSSGMMFLFGAAVGILVNKVVSETLAKKKRNKLIEACLEAATKVVESIGGSDDDDDEEESPVVDIKDELKKLREEVDAR